MTGKSSRNQRTIMNHYKSTFREGEKRFLHQRQFIHLLCKDAFNQFMEMGFPTTRTEAWRSTNVSSLVKIPFTLPNGEGGTINKKFLDPYLLQNSHRIVIINGKISSTLSDFDRLSDSVTIQSLSAAIQESPELLERHLGKYANFVEHPFVALNSAFLSDGLFLLIKRGQTIEVPIHLIFLSAPSKQNTIFHWRNLILTDKESNVTLIEHYIGSEGCRYFSNGVTEIVSEENATLQHIKIQQESHDSYHISTTQIQQMTNSQISSHHITIGANLTRNDVNVVLSGEGTNCSVNGLTLSKEKQHMDNHTMIEHVKPNCISRELYKGIYDDHSHGVFNGRIIVHKNAQKTDAKQTNRNLILSTNAKANSNPQLEIHADDVKCSHGSSTGELDEEALFYLRSRGINLNEAIKILINGFANEVIDRINVTPLKDRLNHLLLEWLSTNRSKT
ncbi:MAG: Fe-S cluster assembly protein SufD [Candidatus Marinimicrobia bacterium]|nr:Fe-S cluster assembly protein SufD [Candidatus Neomarinimicrobiota bacterium]